MSVWIVVASCGDYYCEEDHVLAISATRDGAEALQREAEGQFSVYFRSQGAIDRYQRWSSVRVERLDVGVLRPEAQGTVTDQRPVTA